MHALPPVGKDPDCVWLLVDDEATLLGEIMGRPQRKIAYVFDVEG